MPIIGQAEVPWIRGYDFGIGADLMSGSPMARVVKVAEDGVTGAGGAIGRFSVQRIRSTAELEQSLGIDVDLSFGSALFGAGVKDRFSFAKSSRVQTNSLFMTLTNEIRLKFLSIDEPQLTDSAAGLVDQPALFETRFGNMFVRGIVRGGFFVGVMRIETESSEDAMAISNELSGSYGLFTGETTTQFREAMSRHRASCFVTMYHEGGPTDLRINDPENPAELLRCGNEFVASFQTQPEQSSVPYIVTLASIAIAEGPPPLNAADIQKSQDVLSFCAKRRSALIDQLNKLQFILDNPQRFDFSASASLQEIRIVAVDTQNDLDLIAACASHAINDPKNAKFPADFAADTPGNATDTFPTAVMPKVMPEPRPMPPDFDGVWDNVLTDPAGAPLGTTVWTMTRDGANRYAAVEEGLGNARGIAMRNELSVTLNWRATNPGDTTTGRYNWTLDPSMTRAEGGAQLDDGRSSMSIMIKRA